MNYTWETMRKQEAWYNENMKKRYNYRAYPNLEQTQHLAQVFGHARWTYNQYLSLAKQEYATSKTYNIANLMRASTTLAKQEHEWLKNVSSVPLQQSARYAALAYSNFFKSVTGKRKGRKVGFPRFKTRYSRQSAEYTQAGFSVRTQENWGYLRLGRLDKEIRFKLSRALPSYPTSVTITREPSGEYYVSFVVEITPNVTRPISERTAGIDLGLTDFASIAYSDGEREKIANPRHLREREARLKKAQQSLSRKQKGSNNREKARINVAREHAKVKRARLDFLNKLTTRLVRENQAIAVETLSITGLARTHLGKSVLDAGWGTFLSQLETKTAEQVRTLVRADRWDPTSQVCSVCGVLDGKKPLSVREWECSACNTVLDRDYNASVNIIVAAGLVETLNARGENVRRVLASVNSRNSR